MIEQVWPKSIRVDKRIVKLLSGATYENFPKALKELIVNAYDADATKVDVNIDLIKETITIEDNGHGMSELDFDFYLRIAFQAREKEGESVSGRKIIGQFGVGFLSVFPFCKNYYIESTKRGLSEVVYANIPSANYFSRSNELIEVEKIQIPGGKKIDKTISNKQFTKIIMRGFTDLTHQYFYPKYKVAPNRFSIKNWNPMDQLIWIMSEDLPVEYKDKTFDDLLSPYSNLPFIVKINKTQIKRNVNAKTVLETHQGNFNKIGKIKFKYFIATNYSVIHPLEARYFKIRNLNVGVGQRDTFGAGTESGTRASLTHLTGDILIIDGLNDLISLDRDKFNYNEDYDKLKEYFRNRLVNLATQTYDINAFAKETKQIDRLKDLRVIDSKSTLNKINKLQNRGFKVIRKSLDEDEEPIQINKEEKTIVISNNNNQFQKTLDYGNKHYQLVLDSWEYRNSNSPAIIIQNKKITINQAYPLFKGKKYTDVFFRFHLILSLNLRNNIISQETFIKINNDLIKTFQDYIR